MNIYVTPKKKSQRKTALWSCQEPQPQLLSSQPDPIGALLKQPDAFEEQQAKQAGEPWAEVTAPPLLGKLLAFAFESLCLFQVKLAVLSKKDENDPNRTHQDKKKNNSMYIL